MCARAPSLPPEQRRQAVLDAVLPLVLEKGFLPRPASWPPLHASPRGTLFRVFEQGRPRRRRGARAFRRTDHLTSSPPSTPACLWTSGSRRPYGSGRTSRAG